jgi:hypothetical protein
MNRVILRVTIILEFDSAKEDLAEALPQPSLLLF